MTAGVPDAERLADLDADIAAGLAADPGAAADPASRAVLDALAATRAELAALPEVPVPPEFAARWAAALHPAPTPERVDETGTQSSPILPTGGLTATEDRPSGAPTATSGRERTDPVITPRSRAAGRAPTRAPGSPVPGREASRSPGGPARRGRVRPAIAVGTALAGLLLVSVVATRPAPPGVTAAELGGVARAAVGAHDAGELNDPVRRARCLRSVAPPGLDPDALLLGGRGVVLDGRPGILLVLATGQLGRFRAVVVDPSCATLLADTRIGR